MATPHISQLHELSARVEEHLHQFMDEEEYGAPKKRSIARQVGNTAIAGAGAVGVAAALDPLNRAKIKAGMKDAAFTGTMRGAKAMNTAGNKVAKVGRMATKAGESRILGKKVGGTALKKGGDLAAGAAGVLKKKGSLLRKTGMRKFFHADLAATMLRIEGKLHEFGA